jgi:diaminopimelate epimerase
MGSPAAYMRPMATPFLKMHGLGNDFVLFDARAQLNGSKPSLLPGAIRRLADRHRGIGFDQLVLVEEPREPGTAAYVRIWNADGGEVAACGNAMRCVAQLLGRPATIATAAGTVRLDPGDGGATVDMGPAAFGWDAIPLAYPVDTAAMPVGWGELEQPSAVSMGNPHAVFFVADPDVVPLDRLGPEIEHDPIFPERVNVNVAAVSDRTHIRLRVWERGAGLTQACGTGACATAVAGMRRGLVERRVTVEQPGGALVIEWTPDGHVLMTGPAATSFRGEVDLEAFA